MSHSKQKATDGNTADNATTTLQICLQRIHQFDPLINAVIELNPDALQIAQALDARPSPEGSEGLSSEPMRSRDPVHGRGPLHGLPVLLKDNIDTADRMQTTAGSLAMAGHHAARDAFLVSRLRSAGAVILGKTNMSEWANFRSTHSSSGWSSRGGQCRNPHALDRSPCGSSSGSAAAVAAGFCVAAVGTETDGSIVCPAAMNGIVGLKPTLGLVSRSGIIPIAHSQDTAGPMARTVADAALLLGCLAGIDPEDAATAAAEGHLQPDYTRFLDKDALRGARLGVSRRHFGSDWRVTAVMDKAIGILKDCGATIVDPADLYGEAAYENAEMQVLLYEFKADLNAYLSTHPDAPVHSLEELMTFNAKHKKDVMPFFGQELFLMAQKKGSLERKRYQRARDKSRTLARAGIDSVLGTYKLDALITASNMPAMLIDPVRGDPHQAIAFSSPAAVSGYPHITIPAGRIKGLPIGLSLVGPAWSEPRLLGFAYAFEQALGTSGQPAFRQPAFLPAIDPGAADHE
ncbi:MAG: amidase [Spirochaetia bacterium]|jgi:amidase|nr:amidase [Spirochaetia bacterium]